MFFAEDLILRLPYILYVCIYIYIYMSIDSIYSMNLLVYIDTVYIYIFIGQVKSTGLINLWLLGRNSEQEKRPWYAKEE